MANNNFVVQNGLTAGSTTIFAGNGDVVSGGNITATGAGSILSKLVVTNFSTANAVITGGSLTGVPLSGGTGSFTTLTTSGVTTLNGNLVLASGTTSTDTTHGALVVVGGVGVAGNVNAVSVIATNGLYSKTNYTGSYADGIVVDYVDGMGRISVGGADGIGFYNGGPANTLLFSISPSGAQVATGTVSAPTLNAATIGNTGAAFTGSSITTTSATFTTAVATNFSSGNAVITGGSLTGVPVSGSTGSFTTLAASGATTLSSTLGVSGTTTAAAITASGQVSIMNSTQSSSTTTGALTVAGGAGIGGNLYVGGNLILAGNTYTTNTTILNEQTGNLIVGLPLSFSAVAANIQYGGNQNSTMQMNAQNQSSGSGASTDYVATANNGNDNDTFIDMGINSSTYSQAGYTSNYPNDGYLYVQGNTTTGGGNLILATMTANDLIFATGGQNANNVVMRVTSGNVVAVKSTNAATNTTSGALQVAGGVGVQGALYASTLYDNGLRVITTATPTAGSGISVTSLANTGPTASWVITNTGVLSLTASTGLSVSATTGAITITNTGVTSAVAGTGISVSAGTGAVTFTNSGVTAVAGTTNQITTSGSTGSVTLSLPSTVNLNTLNAATIGNIGANVVGTGTYLTSLSGGSITAGSVPNSALTNSSITVNGTSISLGSTVTITANAGTLTGSTLASGVTASSLTSVGTLGSLTVTGTVSAGTFSGSGASLTGTASSLTAGTATTATNVTTQTGSSNGNYFPLFVASATAGSQVPYENSAFTMNPSTGVFSATSFSGAGTGLTGTASSLSIGGTAGSETLATVTGRGATTATALVSTNAPQAWGSTTPGLTVGGIHLGAGSSTSNAGPAITFGARDASAGATAQAGIYLNTDGTYGTKMYFATTDSYATGSKVAMYVDQAGAWYLPRAGVSINTSGVYSGKATTAQYADLAENYLGDIAYEPGTVVMFGGEKEVTLAEIETIAVAGVVSTNPAHLMNAELEGETVVALALQGRVPCKVYGPVRKGDMMVSAGNGYAKASKNPSLGQVIGKALENLAEGKGVIEVVVGRL